MQVLALSIEEKQADPKIDPIAQIKKFRKAHGVTYPTLSDEKAAVMEKFGFTSIPQNIVIDKNGKYRGNPQSIEEIVATVQKLNK